MPIKNAIHSQQVYDPTDESIMAEQELWMLLACIFLIFKNAPAVHQV
mgnify:CR=1 FL=1